MQRTFRSLSCSLAKSCFLGAAAVTVFFAEPIFAQGTVWFNTKVGGGGVDVPVLLDGTLEGPGPAYSAQLFLVDDSLTPLFPATVFQPRGSGAAAIASRYVVPVDVAIPGFPIGSVTTLVMRAWKQEFGSFEGALRNGYGYGQSAPFVVQLGGGALPPAYLDTLQPFTIVIPEPTLFLDFACAAMLLQYCFGLNEKGRIS